jgi:hypothetical protein
MDRGIKKIPKAISLALKRECADAVKRYDPDKNNVVGTNPQTNNRALRCW